MSNYAKLKTNLKLAIQRLKLLEKKKTEQSLKARKEIADFLAINKADRARIRVEHIIREDNFVEAMEMLEMFCDLLLARFGLIEKMNKRDPGLDEALVTIMWAAPRISSDIQEFQTIAEIFAHKYGRPFAEECKVNAENKVNDKVLKRLGIEPPPKLLVEKYLIEIAKNFNVPFEPDRMVMLEAGESSAELIDLREQLDDIMKNVGNNNSNNNNNNNGGSNAGFVPLEPTAAAASAANYPPSSAPPPSNHLGFDNLAHSVNNGTENQAPALPSKSFYANPSNLNEPSINADNGNNANSNYFQTPPPSYHPAPQYPPKAGNNYKLDDDDIKLPGVPTHMPSSEFGNAPPANSNNDSEFDDLQKRFQNLKKK